MTNRKPISLPDLLAEARIQPIDILGNPQVMITGISTHAQRTGRNEMFVALSGTRTDSHMLVREAVAAGASVLLVEKEIRPLPGVTIVRVADTKQSIGHLAHVFFRSPARAMTVCGITGTNGKTSVTRFVHDILKKAGRRPGMIGTLGASFADRHIALNNTTPGALELAGIFHEMEEARVDCVVMECSSHAIDQGRINGIPFRCGALTGISQDHLDYHGDFQSYVECKRRLFTDFIARTPGSVSCFNVDDPSGKNFAEAYSGDMVRFTANGGVGCAVRAAEVSLSASGTAFTLEIEGRKARIQSDLIGSFSVSNMLAASSCAHVLGIDFSDIVRALESMTPVPGRFEVIDEGQPFTVIVDYAHTPDALERVLRFARGLCANRLLVAFGCGGDRDRGKRPIMGKVAGDNADFVVVTNDNPRTEDPSVIARHAVEGILRSTLKSNRYQLILDRRHAIETVLTMAAPGDVVLIAGKGHEDYQEIGGSRHRFDDREVARAILRDLLGNYSRQQADQPLTEQIS